ncbi:hypothetical protein COLO4_07730 [Corchorus olitorius]|uniref:Uncharacterized protein n=1 Tax=Corchorus olitorius TaxID=93759 RepID=A0A1R3KIW9_9ROSI|nr:hypothetical protein COLO4_07730 [Corchorus olitorius]
MEQINRICCYGATRLGVLTTLVLARNWERIEFTVLDDQEAINWWTSANPVREEDGQDRAGEFISTQDLLNLRIIAGNNNGRVRFTHDSTAIDETIRRSQIIFLALEKGLEEKKGRKRRRDIDAPKWIEAVQRIKNVSGNTKIIVERFPLINQLHPTSEITQIENPNAPLNADQIVRSLYHGTQHRHTIIVNPMIPSYGRILDDLLRPNAIVIARKSPPSPANNDDGHLDLYSDWDPNVRIVTGSLIK